MLVEGSPEDLAFFKQTMNVPDKWGTVKVLSEEPLIPYPEEFREQDKRVKEWEVKLDEYAKISPDKAREYEEQNPRPKDGYNSGGYEWEKKHYGTKWGFADSEIVGETENSISYVFQSAWSPPSGLFKIMGEKFPNLEFTIDYEEEGMDFAGTYEIRGDDISNLPREVTEKCPECGEPIDMCKCEKCPECGKLLDASDSDDECDCEERKKKEQKTREWEERWHKRSSISIPNIDYGILHNAKLNKKAGEKSVHAYYNGKLYQIELYEEGGHNLLQFSVNEINPATDEKIQEIYSSNDAEEINELFEDGFMDWRNPSSFIQYLDEGMGKIKESPSSGKSEETEKWEERWHKRSNIKCAIGEEEWDVYGYDVWGNEEDGFDVNDVYRLGSVTLPENADLEQIIEVLKEGGHLKEIASPENIDESGMGDENIIYLDEDNGCPLMELRKKGVAPESEREQKIREWQERWHKRSGTKVSVVEEKVVEAEGLML